MFGATTVSELLELAEQAEGSGIFESLWVGDNLLAKPRLDSVTLLSALAVLTKTCRLGTACMASFPLRDPVENATCALPRRGSAAAITYCGILSASPIRRFKELKEKAPVIWDFNSSRIVWEVFKRHHAYGCGVPIRH